MSNLKNKVSEYALIDRCTKLTYALNKGSTRIGKNRENNIRITHPSCSKYHATITIKANIIWFHDFSNNGTYVCKRNKFILLKNATTRIYENSRFQIANKEFKLIKLKNEVIEISDSDDEMQIKTINETAEIRENNINNDTNDGDVNHWKKKILEDLITTHTEEKNNSYEENNKNNNNKKRKVYKSKEFIDNDSESDSESEINFSNDEESNCSIKREPSSNEDDEYNNYN